MEIIGPNEWYAILDTLEEEKGISILLGATDTGKSTLAKFLIFNLCKRGLKVALVDADIGQSFLGPPTTIGFPYSNRTQIGRSFYPHRKYFSSGLPHPKGIFRSISKGVKRMVDKAPSYGADVIIVDTTGFILGEAGKELKRRKIDLLSPRFIIALQKSDEIEHVLDLYKENPLYKILRLPLSDQVRPKSMEERRINRTNKFQDYFKHAVIQELAIENVQIEGEVLDPNGDILPLDWALKINGLLIGLKDSNDETLALGVIRNYIEERKVLRVLTPLSEIQGVKMIQLSSLKVILLYEEERV